MAYIRNPYCLLPQLGEAQALELGRLVCEAQADQLLESGDKLSAREVMAAAGVLRRLFLRVLILEKIASVG